MPTKTCDRGAWDPVTITYDVAYDGHRFIVRPTRVEGTVGGTAVTALPAAMYPVSSYHNFITFNGDDPLDTHPHDDLPEGFHRGHIFARALGGVNTPYNLVPMPQAINNGLWAAMERDLAAAHAGKPPGNRIYVRVDLGYPEPNAGDPTIPSSVEAWGYRLATIGGGAAARTTALDAAIAAGAANRVHHVTPALNLSAVADQPFVFDLAQHAALTAVENAYNGWGGAPVVGGGDNFGTVAGGRGDPPVAMVPGPYAFLDVLEDNALGPALIAGLNAAFGPAAIGPAGLNYPANGVTKYNNRNYGVEFRPHQKQMIRLVNRWRNHGRLTSDNTWFDGGYRLFPSRTEIDHLIPVAAAAGNSSNYYWNAQVASKRYNQQKGNSSEAAFQIAYNQRPAAASGARTRVRRMPIKYQTRDWRR